MSVSLVYLSYIPFGIKYLQSFLNSYSQKHPGIDHTLVIVFNGHDNLSAIEPFFDILKNSGVTYEYIITAEKFDIGAYFHAARNLQSEFIAFVNTYSIILHDNWLLYLYKNASLDGIGCVSATGSWGDFKHNDEYRILVKRLWQFHFNLNSLKKIFFFRFNFYPAVQPHLRTNAFMIRRILFLDLNFSDIKPRFLNSFIKLPVSKLKSLCFEHGNDGLTCQITRMGLKLLVVNKYGKGYEIEQWMDAKTFWVSNQENLLVSDNQTLKYGIADEHERCLLKDTAWGLQNNNSR